jgi:hypothetical protein
MVNLDASLRKPPAFSMGGRTKSDYSKCFSRLDMVGLPLCTICTLLFPHAFSLSPPLVTDRDGPGPNTYNPPSNLHSGVPAYSMGGRTQSLKNDQTPGTVKTQPLTTPRPCLTCVFRTALCAHC